MLQSQIAPCAIDSKDELAKADRAGWDRAMAAAMELLRAQASKLNYGPGFRALTDAEQLINHIPYDAP